MKAALKEAEKALLSGEFPVGCVVVYKNRIVATGSRSDTTGRTANEINHAEMVALGRLSGLNESLDSRSMTLYSTMEPCLMCFGAILINGIGKIVYAYEDIMGGGTKCDLNRLPQLYSDRNISIISHVLRKESLSLFQIFFSNPENLYWKGSLLAEYTLRQ